MEEIEKWEKCGEGERCTYEVSNLGRVKSITKVNKKERVLKGIDDNDGYLQVNISKKLILIHHLVMYAFKGPRPEGLVIDHEDRNKLNNKADNLRYVTRSENQQNRDYYRHDILTTDTAERKKVFVKEYREANRETISEKAKEKYTCKCGSILQKISKARHERESKKHKAYLENLNK